MKLRTVVLGLAGLIVLGCILFSETVKACIVFKGPVPQEYFLESYNLSLPSDLPKGITFKMPGDGWIRVTSNVAPPVYVLIEARDKNAKYEWGNIKFPQGFVPTGEILPRQVLRYEEGMNRWEVDQELGDSAYFEPTAIVNMSWLNFKLENVRSADPNFKPSTPATENKIIRLMITSKYYDAIVSKTYTPDSEYKTKAIKEIKDAQERDAKREAEQKAYDRSFNGIVAKILNWFWPNTVKVGC